MSEPKIQRGEIWWVSLAPTKGSEIKKTRPCLVLTNDTLNRLRKTVVVVPLSTAARAHPPITVAVHCDGRKAVGVVDQVRAVAKHRFKSRIGTLAPAELEEICQAVTLILELG